MIKKVLLILLGLIILAVTVSIYAFYPHRGPTNLTLPNGGYEINIPEGYSAVQNRFNTGDIEIYDNDRNVIVILEEFSGYDEFDSQEDIDEQIAKDNEYIINLNKDKEIYISSEETVLDSKLKYFSVLYLTPCLEQDDGEIICPEDADEHYPYMLSGSLHSDNQHYSWSAALKEEDAAEEVTQIIKNVQLSE